MYLGTRHALELGAAIGIGMHAGGRYTCLAQNGNANRSVTIEVQVNGKYNSMYIIIIIIMLNC